jgi:hypothetical protein
MAKAKSSKRPRQVGYQSTATEPLRLWPTRALQREIDRRSKSDPVGVATDNDAELLALAKNVEDAVGVRVRLARGLVERPSDYTHVADLGKSKRSARRTLERLLRALNRLRDEDGAPYLDAKMFLTGCILDRASLARPLSEHTKPTIAIARGVAKGVAQRFPALAARMGEPARIEKILRAITGAATSAKRTPWTLIVSTWDGIEARPPDVEQWRVSWWRNEKKRS